MTNPLQLSLTEERIPYVLADVVTPTVEHDGETIGGDTRLNQALIPVDFIIRSMDEALDTAETALLAMTEMCDPPEGEPGDPGLTFTGEQVQILNLMAAGKVLTHWRNALSSPNAESAVANLMAMLDGPEGFLD